MMSKMSFVAVMSAVVLAGCGGSSGSSVSDLLDTQLERPAENEVLQERQAFLDEFGPAIENDDFADLSTLATTGTATFDGLIGIGSNEVQQIVDGDYVSRVRFVLDLGTNQIDGVANGFVRQNDGSAVDGALNFDGAFLRDSVATQTNFGASGMVDGALTNAEGDVSTYDGTFEGDFFGEGVGAFESDADGTVQTVDADGNVVADAATVFDADIITRREQ